MNKPSRKLLNLTPPHYHGELTKFINQQEASGQFKVMLYKNKRLWKALDDEIHGRFFALMPAEHHAELRKFLNNEEVSPAFMETLDANKPLLALIEKEWKYDPLCMLLTDCKPKDWKSIG